MKNIVYVKKCFFGRAILCFCIRIKAENLSNLKTSKIHAVLHVSELRVMGKTNTNLREPETSLHIHLSTVSEMNFQPKSGEMFLPLAFIMSANALPFDCLAVCYSLAKEQSTST